MGRAWAQRSGGARREHAIDVACDRVDLEVTRRPWRPRAMCVSAWADQLRGFAAAARSPAVDREADAVDRDRSLQREISAGCRRGDLEQPIRRRARTASPAEPSTWPRRDGREPVAARKAFSRFPRRGLEAVGGGASSLQRRRPEAPARASTETTVSAPASACCRRSHCRASRRRSSVTRSDGLCRQGVPAPIRRWRDDAFTLRRCRLAAAGNVARRRPVLRERGVVCWLGGPLRPQKAQFGPTWARS